MTVPKDTAVSAAAAPPAPTATRPVATAPRPSPTPRLRGDPPEGLVRITRLGHTLLDVPVQVVAVSRSASLVLASTPGDADEVPVQVARRLSTAEGVMTVDAADGTSWAGAAVGPWGDGIRVALCGRAVTDGGRSRAALTDLAALAGEVLRLQVSEHDAEGLRELLGTASHDLRNPLSVLRAGLETLALHSDDLPSGQTERIAEVAVRQARRMSGMIDGLLSLNGLGEEVDRTVVDLRDLAGDAVEAGRLSHELVELRLERELPDEPVLVRAIPDSLARVLTNLVTNAAVHGGGTVWVGLEVQDHEAVLRVSDDGPGMPKDSALDTGEQAQRAGGHGLGLVIATRIVRAQGGTIAYDDRPGGGTIVELRLPVAASAD